MALGFIFPNRINLDWVIKWMWGLREKVSNMTPDFWLKQVGYCSVLLRQKRGRRRKCMGKRTYLKEAIMSSVLSMCEKPLNEDVKLHMIKELRRKIQARRICISVTSTWMGTGARKIPQGKWVYKEETLSKRVPRPIQWEKEHSFQQMFRDNMKKN